MVKDFCDRCGTELDGEARHRAHDIKVNNFTEMSMVCQDCLRSLKRWMSREIMPPDDTEKDKMPHDHSTPGEHEEVCKEFAQVINVYDSPIEPGSDDDYAYYIIWADGLESLPMRYCPFCGEDISGKETAIPLPRENLRRYRASLSPDDHPWTKKEGK